MGDPITTSAKAKPIKCGRYEELVEWKDGRKECHLKFGPGMPASVGIPPVRGKWATIKLDEPTPPKKPSLPSPPPPPKDQFQPGPPRDLTKLITGRAEYSCKTRMPYTENRIVTRDVSIAKIPNESEKATRARLEKAARDLTKTITGCHNVKFERLEPTAEERAEAAVKTSKPSSTKPEIDPMSEWNRICGPQGKWAGRPVCRK